MAIPMKLRFVKTSTYGTTWNGYVGNQLVCTVERTYSDAKSGGFVYSLHRVNETEVLEASCYLADVTRRAKSAVEFLLKK